MKTASKKVASKKPTPKRASTPKLPPASIETRAAVHAAIERLLDAGATVFVIHAELGPHVQTVTFPASIALAEGMVRNVFAAWFPHLIQAIEE